MGYRTQRGLRDVEKLELEQLNNAVTAAIQARRAWLDAKMVETSRLQPGDDIYDVGQGRKLGVVSELYRFHTDRNDLYDTSYYCDYTYSIGQNMFDNTSRQSGVTFGTREDAVAAAEQRAARLREAR